MTLNDRPLTVRAIEDSSEGFVFSDLVLPEGSIPRLVLGKNYLDRGSIRTHLDWIAYDRACSHEDFRTIPFWLRYALMRLCYERSEDALSKRIRQEVWIRDTKVSVNDATRVFYGTTSVEVVHGEGYPDGHLCKVRRTCTRPTKACLRSLNAKSLRPTLQALVFDNDPGRTSHVLEWASYSDLDRSLSTADRRHPLFQDPSQNYVGPALIRCDRSNDDQLLLRTIVPTSALASARGVRIEN